MLLKDGFPILVQTACHIGMISAKPISLRFEVISHINQGHAQLTFFMDPSISP
jgi:hypothetical protein